MIGPKPEDDVISDVAREISWSATEEEIRTFDENDWNERLVDWLTDDENTIFAELDADEVLEVLLEEVGERRRSI